MPGVGIEYLEKKTGVIQKSSTTKLFNINMLTPTDALIRALMFKSFAEHNFWTSPKSNIKKKLTFSDSYSFVFYGPDKNVMKLGTDI